MLHADFVHRVGFREPCDFVNSVMGLRKDKVPVSLQTQWPITKETKLKRNVQRTFSVDKVLDIGDKYLDGRT